MNPPDYATITEAFLRTVRLRGDETAVRTVDDEIRLTWKALYASARETARGLHRIGVRRGECVALLLGNRPEFNVCDVAAILMGAVPFSIYYTSSAEQIAYVLKDSGARVIVTEQARLGVVTEAHAVLARPSTVVVVDGSPPPDGHTLADVRAAAAGTAYDPAAEVDSISGNDLFTLIYTSGTTGDPKGVEITHANMRAVDHATLGRVHWAESARVISWLPAAHIAERAAHHYLPMIHGASITTCRDPRLIADYLRAVEPTWFFAVPRVWEKLRVAIEADLAAAPDLERAVAAASKGFK